MKSPIVQEDEYGCGAACVAFVLNISYKEAVALMGIQKAKNKGFFCQEIETILRRYGKNYMFKYLKPRLKKKIYKDKVIVFIKRSKNYPAGHYLVRHKGFWMDSWANIRQENEVKQAYGKYKKRLPGKPIYALIPIF